MKTNKLSAEILQKKSDLLDKMADICDNIDLYGDIYLGDVMSDCMSAITADSLIAAPFQLRKLGNLLDKRGLFDLAEDVDSLLPDILELKTLVPDQNSTVNKNSLPAEKAYKMASKLRHMYLEGEVDEKSFEYKKMSELETMLRAGFILPSDRSQPQNFNNWWDYFTQNGK